MTTRFEVLEAEALKLDPAERARLVEHLIASLDEDTEIDESWATEVARRAAEADAGAVRLVTAADALAQARAALK